MVIGVTFLLDIKIQVKKESKRPEARIQRKDYNDEIMIKYVVPVQKDIDNPKYAMPSILEVAKFRHTKSLFLILFVVIFVFTISR